MPGAIGWAAQVLSQRGGIKDGIAVPDAGILLGGASLPHAGGSEADDRRALVVVACPVASLGDFGPQCSVHRSRVRLAHFRGRRCSRRRSRDSPKRLRNSVLSCSTMRLSLAEPPP